MRLLSFFLGSHRRRMGTALRIALKMTILFADYQLPIGNLQPPSRCRNNLDRSECDRDYGVT